MITCCNRSNTVTDTLTYTLLRSHRRTVSLQVHQGDVRVRAPLRTPRAWIDDFVQSKQHWIQQQRMREQLRDAKALRIEHGVCIPFLDSEKTLHLASSRRYRAQLLDDRILLQGPALEQPEPRLKLFRRFLSQQADIFMTPRVLDLAAQLKLEHRLAGIRYRHTASRWGCCSAQGQIQFNPLILLAPTAVMDYLIVHELCHLQVMNHSAAFWAHVAAACPAHEQHRRWLRENEAHLRLTAEAQQGGSDAVLPGERV